MQGLGAKLKSRARELGLSDREVAARLGLSPTRYAKYVLDDREPDLELLVKIGRLLALTPNDLLLPDPPVGLSDAARQQARIMSALSSLGPEDQELLAAMVEAAAAQRANKK